MWIRNLILSCRHLSRPIALPLKIKSGAAAGESYCSLSLRYFRPTVNLNLPNYLWSESRLHDYALSFTKK